MVKQGLIPFDKLSVLYVLGRFLVTRTGLPRDLLPFFAPYAAVRLVERLCVRPPRDRLRHRRGAARGPRAGRL